MATIIGTLTCPDGSPFLGEILIQPQSTPLADAPSVIVTADVRVDTESDGTFSVALKPGYYLFSYGRGNPLKLAVPDSEAEFNLLSLIVGGVPNAAPPLPASAVGPATATTPGTVKTSATVGDPVAALQVDLEAVEETATDADAKANQALASASAVATPLQAGRVRVSTSPDSGEPTVPRKEEVDAAITDVNEQLTNLRAGGLNAGSIPSSKLKTTSNEDKIGFANLKEEVTSVLGSGLNPEDYQGEWNPTTDTPTIPTAAGNNDHWYFVTVAGTATGNAVGTYAAGDRIKSNGSVWQRLPVTPTTLNDGSVTPPKLTTGAATRTKVPAGAINASKISSDLLAKLFQDCAPTEAVIAYALQADGKLALGLDALGRLMLQGQRLGAGDFLTDLPDNQSDYKVGIFERREDGLFNVIGAVKNNGDVSILGGIIKAGGNAVLVEVEDGLTAAAVAPYNVAETPDKSATTFYEIIDEVYRQRRMGRNGKGHRDVYQPADINHLLLFGQSNSRRQDSLPALTTTPSTSHLMFNEYSVTGHDDSGLLAPNDETGSTEYRVDKITGFQPYYEGGIDDGETMAGGWLAMMSELVDWKFLVSGAGVGGYSIANLSEGMFAYANLIYQVTRAKALCDEQGLTYKVPCVLWIQGEANQNTATYHTQLATLVDGLNEDIKAITGQTEDVVFFIEQVTRPTDVPPGIIDPLILQAHVDALASGRIYLQGPRYPLTMSAHYTNYGKQWRGVQHALCAYRVLVENREWEPVRVRDYTVSGNNLFLRFHVPVKPLRWHTGQNNPTLLALRGFEATGLTAVSIIADDKVKLVNSSGWAGKTLKYALQVDGVKGNLADSDATVSPLLDAASDPYDLANWCVSFELTIPA